MNVLYLSANSADNKHSQFCRPRNKDEVMRVVCHKVNPAGCGESGRDDYTSSLTIILNQSIRLADKSVKAPLKSVIHLKTFNNNYPVSKSHVLSQLSTFLTRDVVT